MPLPALGALGGAAAISVFIRLFVGYLITRLVVSLGIAFTVYSGLDWAFDQLFNLTQGYLSALPSDVLTLFKILGVDVAIGMLVATITAVITFKSLTGAYRTMTIGN